MFPDGSHLAEPTNEELADKLGLERTAMQHVYDLIIVGGGPTGLTTSIYAARENLETLIIDSKGLGGQAGVTERLDNYPGFPEGIGGAELADRIVRQAQRYDVEMLQALSVASITDDGDREIEWTTSNGDHYHARAVVVATGSSYRRTGAEGEDDLIGAGYPLLRHVRRSLLQGSERALVLGGGNSGLEEGQFLTDFTDKVTIVEYKDRLAGSQVLQDKVTNHPKMEVLLQREALAFRPKDDGSGKIGTVELKNLETGETEEHHPAGVFVFIGLDPNTGFLPTDRARRPWVRRDGRSLHDIAPGRLRGGRRPRRVHEAARERRGRRRGGAIEIRTYLASSSRGRDRARTCERPGSEGDLRADHQGGREAQVRERRERGASSWASPGAARASAGRGAGGGDRCDRAAGRDATGGPGRGGLSSSPDGVAERLRSIVRCSSLRLSSVSRPVTAIVVRNCSSARVQPSQPSRCDATLGMLLDGERPLEEIVQQLDDLLAGMSTLTFWLRFPGIRPARRGPSPARGAGAPADWSR